jgi:hypothetical protein
MAADLGNDAMVDLLLEFGARNNRIENTRREDGGTPAERALACGFPEIAARLEGSSGERD